MQAGGQGFNPPHLHHQTRTMNPADRYRESPDLRACRSVDAAHLDCAEAVIRTVPSASQHCGPPLRAYGVYWAVVPPSITSSAPVTNDDSSDAR